MQSSLVHQSRSQSRTQSRPKTARYARGQGMTEYIVVLALVVVAAIGVYSFFGKTVRTQMAGVAKEISGQSADQQIRQSEQAANTASSTANQNYGLGNYDEGTHSGN